MTGINIFAVHTDFKPVPGSQTLGTRKLERERGNEHAGSGEKGGGGVAALLNP